MRFDLFNVGFQCLRPAFQPVKQARVVRRAANDRLRQHAVCLGVFLYARDDVMDLMHDANSAKRHQRTQVPIDLWREVPNGALICAMTVISKTAFRDALRWHMDRTGTRPADLAHGTGVSENVIKKLRSGTRDNNSTGVENAVPIAAYFGMSVEKFLRKEPPDHEPRLKELSDLLLPEEERMVEAQVIGILRARGQL